MPCDRNHLTGGGVTVVAAFCLLAANASAQTLPPAAAPTPPWLVADSSDRTVTLAFQVTPAPDGGAALLNGYRNGELQIVVPLNWTVQWDWRSADSTALHSLVVMAEREKLPTEGGRAAFTNAMTRSVTDGLRVGQGDRTNFTPIRRAGTGCWTACPATRSRASTSGCGWIRTPTPRAWWSSAGRVGCSIYDRSSSSRSISASNPRIIRSCCAPVASP
jgi:Sulfocyanin (SoxE).